MKSFPEFLNERWNEFLLEDSTHLGLESTEIYISFLSIDWRETYAMLLSQHKEEGRNGYMVAGDVVHELFQSFMGVEFSEIPIRARIGDIIFRGRIDYYYPYELVPVEIKTSKSLPEYPYEKHISQLTAYMKILEAEYGYLMYISRNSLSYRVFKIPFSEVRWRMIYQSTKIALYLYNEQLAGGGTLWQRD